MIDYTEKSRVLDLFLELIESHRKHNIDEFTKEELKIISIISGIAVNTKIFKENQNTDFFKDMNASEVYFHIVVKIAEAPTELYALSAILLGAPVLHMKLEQAGSYEGF